MGFLLLILTNLDGTTRILGMWDQTAENGGFELTGNRPFLFPEACGGGGPEALSR
mgnify:CR=1 FL=1